jgi:translocation and assembly module TamB
MATHRRSRAARALGRTAGALGTAAVFAAAAVGGVLLHSATPAERRLIVAAANRAMADALRGTVEIAALRRLCFGGVDDAKIVVRDASGAVVLVADGVTARLELRALAWALVRGKGELPIVLTRVHVRSLEATLVAGPEGAPTLADALSPRHPSSPGSSSRGTRLELRDLWLETARAHGRLASFEALDVTLTGLAASATHGAAGTTADVRPFRIEAQGVLRRAVAGTIEAHLALPASGERDARASFEGAVGDVPLTLRAEIEGDHVDARADVPEARPEALRALAPEVDLAEPAEAHVQIRGTLPDLQPAVHVRAGGGTIDLGGTVSVAQVKRADLSLNVARVDLHRVARAAPSLTVGARARLHARVDPDGALSGDASLTADAGATLDAHARFARAPGEAGPTVDFDLHATERDLSRVAALRRMGVHGAADVRATGRADLDRRTVEAVLEAQAAGVETPTAAVQLAVASARVRGPLNDPAMHLVASAEGLRVSSRAIDHVAIDAVGPARTPTVTVAARRGQDTLAARAALEIGPGVAAQQVVVGAVLDRREAAASAERIYVGGGRVDVTGLEVTGLGAPIAGELHASERAVVLRLAAPDIDLPQLAAIAGDKSRVRGHARLDVDVAATREGATGRVEGQVDGLATQTVHGGDATVAILLDGRRVDGGARVAVDQVRAAARLDGVEIAGPPTDPRSWSQATGAVDIDSTVDLASLQRMLPDGALAVQQMSGSLALRAHVARLHPTATPDITLAATTHGLDVVARAGETHGVDLQLAATVEGSSHRIAVGGAIVDRYGTVAQLQAEAEAPLHELLAAQGRREVVERMPVRAQLEVPMRELSSLPPVLRPPALRGRLGASLEVTGNLLEPRVHLRARALGLQPMDSRSAVPFDGAIDATYDGRAAIVRTILQRPEGVVLDARADVDARVRDLLAPPEGGLPWDATANVAIHGFPLESVPQLAERGIGGRASGVVTLEGLHRDARLDANVTLEKPHLGVVCFDGGYVRLRADQSRLQVATAVSGPGSHAAVSVDAAMRWGSDLAPSLDARAPIDATLDASAFRAAALMPLLEGAVDQLDGRVDARARVHVEPALKTGTFDGDVQLSKGILEVPAVGEQLHDVSARLSIRPWGTLRIDDIRASGTSGRLAGKAQAQLDGMTLKGATADVEIPHDQRMPLSVEGVSLGEASGRMHADVTVAPDQRRIDVAVQVPDLEMRLPASTGHGLQSLDPAPDVAIGMRDPEGHFVVLPQGPPEKPRPPGATKIHVAVQLGRDVRIRRDTTLDVHLTGSPEIEIDHTSVVRGTVHLTRGMVEVFGKRFKIEPSSTISFTGDSGNPELVVTASYDSPGSTRIYADVVGPVKTLKVNLRSEPARSQDEILGLLLFGSEEGMGGTPSPDQQPDATQRAAGLASGVVTQGINKALSGITSLDVATRLDTSESANPRPELDVRISNDVMARVAVNTGMPAPGEPPDRTMLSIDWRFKPRWSLETTVGDQGSTLFDLLWRHRY